MDEEYISVPEQGGRKLIPKGLGKPGHIYTVSYIQSEMIGVYKIENQVVSGSGKFKKSGVASDREAKESLDTALESLQLIVKELVLLYQLKLKIS